MCQAGMALEAVAEQWRSRTKPQRRETINRISKSKVQYVR